jgi:predicted regulator of Ras-like GTPase activity (Roadblock/LC7/MglB family)
MVNQMPTIESLKAASVLEGEITGLGLSDIIQLKAQNRFSGCIDVRYVDRRGLIFLRDGEIVHAEHGGLIGEAAFYEIITWPGGRFVVQENVATTQSTIKRSCAFLVLEAHRLMDERRASGEVKRAAPAVPPPATAKPIPAAALLEKLRAIPGVAYAVLQGKNGVRIGDDSYAAEVLAGQTLYLAMQGHLISETLKAGEVHSAVVQGSTRHLLLLVGKSHFVTALVEADAEVGAIEVEMRKVLAAGR